MPETAAPDPETDRRTGIPGLVLAATALGLFLLWSNSFIAISYLLGAEAAAPRFDWMGLTVARFTPIAPLAAGYCLLRRRAESLRLLRRRWPTLTLTGLLAVPGYNFALFYGQQHGVPAPVASLVTALVPLFVMVLAAIFLGERITGRRAVGFTVALAGMITISLARGGIGAPGGYAGVVAITALAPLSWSFYSVISAPRAREASPLVWTYLGLAIGTLPLYALLPFRGGSEMARLDPTGWAALLFLSLLCTLLGFGVWTWLLRHLPASSVGFTVFLNPPLTTLSKFTLSAALPASFAFTIAGLEWVGGALALAGLAIAVARRR